MEDTEDENDAESDSLGARVPVAIKYGAIILGIVIFSVIVASVSTFLYGRVYLPSDPDQRLDVFLAFVAVAANTALTGALILVYVRQNDTLENQTETLEKEAGVLEEQQELMRAQMKPAIEPYGLSSRYLDNEDRTLREATVAKIIQLNQIGFAAKFRIDEQSKIFELGDPHTESETIGKDEIRFKLANTGYGIAKDFRLLVKLRVLDDNPEYSGGGAWVAMHRLDRVSIRKFAKNTVKAGQEDIEFKSSIKLGILESSDNYSTHTFSDAIDILSDRGISDVEVVFELHYSDVFDNSYENQFFSYIASIEPGMSLTHFMKADPITLSFENEHANGD